MLLQPLGHLTKTFRNCFLFVLCCGVARGRARYRPYGRSLRCAPSQPLGHLTGFFRLAARAGTLAEWGRVINPFMVCSRADQLGGFTDEMRNRAGDGISTKLQYFGV